MTPKTHLYSSKYIVANQIQTSNLKQGLSKMAR